VEDIMSATSLKGDELDRLVERHIELSELFEGRKSFATRILVNRAGPRHLVTAAGDKGAAECLTDLVDRALVAYEGRDFAQDSTILALKAALVDAIQDGLGPALANKGGGA
jgi:hypothetical protein